MSDNCFGVAGGVFTSPRPCERVTQQELTDNKQPARGLVSLFLFPQTDRKCHNPKQTSNDVTYHHRATPGSDTL